jgi:hypothetical protein
MNDSELGTRLRQAAPRVTAPLDLASHRERILKEARMRGGRRLRLWTGSLAACALLVGGGSVAFGGDDNITPWGWIADNVFSVESETGSSCIQGILVMWEDRSEDDPLVQDAKAFVSGLDLGAIDTAEAEEEIRSSRTSHGASDGNIKQQAVTDTVADMLWAHLGDRAENLHPDQEISLYSVTEACE